MTNLDGILKSRDIILLTKVHIVKARVFPAVMYAVRTGPWRSLSAEELMLFNCGAGEDSSESLGLPGDQTSQSQRKSTLDIHWKDWCWSWSSNTLTFWWKELTLCIGKKTLMLGKVEGKRRSRQKKRWLDSFTDSMNVNLSKLWEMVEDRGAWRATVHGVAKSWTQTQWLNTNNN